MLVFRNHFLELITASGKNRNEENGKEMLGNFVSLNTFTQDQTAHSKSRGILSLCIQSLWRDVIKKMHMPA